MREKEEKVLLERIDRLERLVKTLLYIAKENGDFWPYSTEAEKRLAAELTAEVEAKEESGS